MTKFWEKIQQGCLISDGAMGTNLQAKGLPIGEPPEKWNITHPNQVKAIHQSFINAGSDLILTNTFGGNRIKLNRAGYGDKVKEFNFAGVQLAREVADPAGVFVAASIGPTGEFLEPVGTVNYELMVEVFAEQIEAVVSTGVDLIIVETMSDLPEAKAAISAAKENSDLPISATMAFDKTARGYRTMTGIDPKTAARGLREDSADLIGANCGSVYMKDMSEILSEMIEAVDEDCFFIAQTNAGVPQLVDGKTVFPDTPENMAKHAAALAEIGVNIIGGCCGTTAEHIKQIKQAIKKNHS